MITYPIRDGIGADEMAEYLGDWEIECVVTADRCEYFIDVAEDDEAATRDALAVLPEYARRYQRH